MKVVEREISDNIQEKTMFQVIWGKFGIAEIGINCCAHGS